MSSFPVPSLPLSSQAEAYLNHRAAPSTVLLAQVGTAHSIAMPRKSSSVSQLRLVPGRRVGCYTLTGCTTVFSSHPRLIHPQPPPSTWGCFRCAVYSDDLPDDQRGTAAAATYKYQTAERVRIYTTYTCWTPLLRFALP